MQCNHNESKNIKNTRVNNLEKSNAKRHYAMMVQFNHNCLNTYVDGR